MVITHEFLWTNRYINFRISSSFVSNFSGEPNEGFVIIIGAGLAGLDAVRQRMSFEFEVTIPEGRN